MAGVKMTGAEYRAFTASDWGEDWYWDDTLFSLNGETVEDIGLVEDGDAIVILEGTIFCGYQHDAKRIDAKTFARQWLRKQSHVTLSVEVPKDSLDEVTALLKAIKGVKIL